MNEIKTIGILGEGRMGTSIFLYLNGFDFNLIWFCSSEEAKESSTKVFNKKTKLLFKCGAITEQKFLYKTENTKITTEYQDLSQCDLIIEAITESIEIKKALFKKLNDFVNEDCIFTTNSSSIIPSKLLPSNNRKEKFTGLHFFFPVHMKNIVELIVNNFTSSFTKNSLLYFLEKINKKAFIQSEENAFLLNRLFLDFQTEAYNLCKKEKLSYNEMDKIIKEEIFPIGVFEFFDHVGIDVMLNSIRIYTKKAEKIDFYNPLIREMEKLVSENKLGLKTKCGFYNYNNPLSQDEDIISEDIRIFVLDKLKYCLYKTAQRFLDNNLCTLEELNDSVKDYMGIDYELL